VRPVTVVLGTAIVLAGCSTSSYKEIYPTLVDGRYDSEFPYRSCSTELEHVGETVRILNVIAYYRVFSFGNDEWVTTATMSSAIDRKRNDKPVFINRSLAGTATVIAYESRHVALLTCAHVVAFPDTVIAYHIGKDNRSTPFIKNIAIKQKQSNFVALLPEVGDLDILAIDRGGDIAVLGGVLEKEPVMPPAVFRFPLGRAKELEWGSFVYLFGYPEGYKMVTKGIVSSPNKDKRGSFLVDAVFSGGFSGGIALAVRDGVPNFELVGIMKTVSGSSTYVLVPPGAEGNDELEYDPTVPYAGDVFVERRFEIKYGIAQAVGVEAIREFLEGHSRELAARGFPLSSFLTRQ
jgi:hypothetical protein